MGDIGDLPDAAAVGEAGLLTKVSMVGGMGVLEGLGPGSRGREGKALGACMGSNEEFWSDV